MLVNFLTIFLKFSAEIYRKGHPNLFERIYNRIKSVLLYYASYSTINKTSLIILIIFQGHYTRNI